MDKTTNEFFEETVEKLKETATKKLNDFKRDVEIGKYDSLKTTAKKAKKVASKAAIFVLEKLKKEE